MIEAREEGSRKTAVRLACLLGSLAAFRRLYTCSVSLAPASAPGNHPLRRLPCALHSCKIPALDPQEACWPLK